MAATFLKSVEMSIRRLFEPISTRIPVKLWNGIAAGLKAKGALTYRNLFFPDTREEIFLKRKDFTGKTIYDIGGHLGLFSVFFAHASGPGGSVHTFEPNPYLYKFVLKNRKLNGFSNLFPHNVGIGAQTEERILTFSYQQLGMGTFSPQVVARLNHMETHTVRARVYSLDDFVDQRGIPLPDFVKMDVEGFEYNVLKGMKRVLLESRPELFIEVHYTNDLHRIYGFLTDRGYRIYHVEAGKWIEPHMIGEMHGHILCSPRPADS